MSLFRRRRPDTPGNGPPDGERPAAQAPPGGGRRAPGDPAGERPRPGAVHPPGAGDQPPSAASAGEQPGHAPSAGELAVGAYVTDGSALFRVAQTIADGRTGNLLVELEDCRTYEVIICSAAALSDLRLAEVKPQHVG